MPARQHTPNHVPAAETVAGDVRRDGWKVIPSIGTIASPVVSASRAPSSSPNLGVGIHLPQVLASSSPILTILRTFQLLLPGAVRQSFAFGASVEGHRLSVTVPRTVFATARLSHVVLIFRWYLLVI